MKARLAIWLSVELVLASGLSTDSCLLRRAEVRAYGAWMDNPTTETKAELDRQRRITAWEHVFFGGMLWAAMATVTVPIVLVISRRKSEREVESLLAA
jgi:hypothetical protein